jgi:hypothetical protein
MWRPRLVARPDRNGRLRVPSSTAEVVWKVAIACAAAVAFLVILRRGAVSASALLLFAAVVALVVGPALRDAWAWFGATDDEREAFRKYIAGVALERDQRPASPSTRRVGSRWSNGFIALLAAVTAAGFALTRYRPKLFIAAICSLVFLLVAVLFRVLETRRARSGGRDRAP